MVRRLAIDVLLLASWLFAGIAAAAVQPFHAPAVTSGSIAVDLHATSVVAASTPVVASFGIPFPRGSIATAGLAQLRVLDGGVEIPAYVEALTPWRHRNNPALDGQSLRVVLVQVEVSFANPALSRRIDVQFGGPPRTLNRPTRATRASTWASSIQRQLRDRRQRSGTDGLRDPAGHLAGTGRAAPYAGAALRRQQWRGSRRSGDD